ncbi:GGDEF domain-containing protein [Endothiovibrio diazotrophicus]
MHDQTEQVVESIIQLTRQRSQDSLERSLVETLMELLKAQEIVFSRLPDMHDRSGLREIVHLRRSSDGDGFEPIDLRDGEPDDPLLLRCFHEGQRIVHPGPGPCCHYPVPFGNETVGVLSLTATKGKGRETLVRGLLRIYENYLSLIDDSERDTLTGLLNRKTFDTRLSAVLDRARYTEGESPTGHERRHNLGGGHWLAVVDIDYFKRINDTFGHLYGDEVLLLLAQLMRRAFRAGDLLFRYGGEEFVIVLAPTSGDDAMAVLNRFRETVAGHLFPQVGTVTVSIGVVEICDQDSPSEVVGHADQALYYAKEHGRNRVCGYRELVALGALQLQRTADDIELF